MSQGGHITADSEHTTFARPVLIVGAGLAGMTAALELSRMGIDVRIIDERPARAAARDTVILHTRTRDLLRQRGLDLGSLTGNLVRDAAVYGNGKLLGMMPVAQADGHRSEFLLTSQADTERAMRELLAAHNVTVEHSTTLIACAEDEPSTAGRPDQPDAGVRAILRHHDGRLEDVLASYLISAEGAQGAVRNLLGPKTKSWPAAHGCLVAEVRADGGLPDDRVCVYLGRRGYLAVFPLGGDRFRCVASNPRRATGNEDDDVEELQRILDAASPTPARLGELSWSQRIPAARAAAPVLRRGRIFFAGESARAHCPASTQGVNAGIHDMINVSWKLAMVLQGQAVAELLDTYCAERMGVIREITRRADLAAAMFGTANAVAHQLVTRVAPVFLDARFVLRLGADLVGELATDYRGGPLSASCGGPGDLHSGDSVPDLRVLACDADAPADALPRETGLHELVDPSRLTLLFTCAAAADPPSWQELAPWRSLVLAHRIAPGSDRPEDRSRFTELFGGRGVFIVRPDLYVAFAGRRRATGRLASWLARWFPAPAGTVPAGPLAA